jgi:hypothetical protein
LGVAVVALVHVGFTVTYDRWNAGAVWFSATGLGFLLLAVLNLAVRADTGAPRVRSVTRAANVVAVLFAVAAVVAVPEPQAFVLLAILAGQALAGLKVLARPT